MSRPSATPRRLSPQRLPRPGLGPGGRRAPRPVRGRGRPFDSRYFLTFQFLPPAEQTARIEALLYEGRQDRGVDWTETLRGFVDQTDRILALLEGFVPEAAWLTDGETLTYLHATVSTHRHAVGVPDTPMHLDVLLADQALTGGLEPRLGKAHLRVLTVNGFPTATWPGLLDELNRLAFPYRWTTRAICMDKVDAARVLTRIRRPVVRQAQVDHGHPQGGPDQRGLNLDRQRRPEQGPGR